MSIDEAEILSSVIRGRRSIRAYGEMQVPREMILKVLEAGQWAPSPGNAQSWKFIVVQEEAHLSALKSFSPGFPRGATAAVTVCSNAEKMHPFYEIFAAEETAMAVENIALMAYSLGLGTCVVASFSKTGIKTLLGIPDQIHPILLIAMGFPVETPAPPKRRHISEVVSWEAYSGLE